MTAVTPIVAEDLAYPVLCLARDDSITVAASPERLRSCNATAWFRNRYFDDLRVIDASATAYRVRAASLAVPLPTWRRLLVWAVNGRLMVNLELEPLAPSSLADAKRMLRDWLHRSPEFWEASRDISEWEHLIAQAPGMEAVCALFD